MMKGLGRILTPARFKSETPLSEIGSTNCIPWSYFRTCKDLSLDLPGHGSQVFKLGDRYEGVHYASLIIPYSYYSLINLSISDRNVYLYKIAFKPLHCVSMPITKSFQFLRTLLTSVPRHFIALISLIQTIYVP